MPKPLVIIISGPNAVGKTTIAKMIADKYNLPLLHKDGFKEILFDNLGVKDAKWSHKLGNTSYDIIHYVSEQLLLSKTPHIIEAPYDRNYERNKIANLFKKYKSNIIQILPGANKDVILKRLGERKNKAERHSGHEKNFKITKPLKEYYKPLKVSGKVYKIDTTDFDNIDLREAHKKIESCL